VVVTAREKADVVSNKTSLSQHLPTTTIRREVAMSQEAAAVGRENGPKCSITNPALSAAHGSQTNPKKVREKMSKRLSRNHSSRPIETRKGRSQARAVREPTRTISSRN